MEEEEAMVVLEVTLGEVGTSRGADADSRGTAATQEAIEADMVGAGTAVTGEAIEADMAGVGAAGMAEATVAGMGVGAAAGAEVMAVGVGADWALDCISRLYRFITTRCGRTECLTIMPTAITLSGTATPASMRP